MIRSQPCKAGGTPALRSDIILALRIITRARWLRQAIPSPSSCGQIQAHRQSNSVLRRCCSHYIGPGCVGISAVLRSCASSRQERVHQRGQTKKWQHIRGRPLGGKRWGGRLGRRFAWGL